MSATTTTPWHKPPKAQHAQIYEALADVLDGVAPCTNKLALYLYRVCIGGRPEEIELYEIPLGEKRTTQHRQGKGYTRTSRRAALKELEARGLLEIVRDYGRGVFRLIVRHLGEIRPFEKLSDASKNWSSEQKTDRKEASNPHETVTSFIGDQRTAEHAAAPLNDLPNESTCELPDSEVTKEEFSPPKELDSADEGLEAAPAKEDDDKFSNTGETVENPESVEICEALRNANLYNPQIKATALKFALREVNAAIALLREREAKQTSRPKNRHGWFVDCLRGKYWLKRPSQEGAALGLPPEFLAAYRKMIAAGACLDVDPNHLSTRMGQIQVRVPKPNSQPWEAAYELVGWRQLWEQVSAGMSGSSTPELMVAGELSSDEDLALDELKRIREAIALLDDASTVFSGDS